LSNTNRLLDLKNRFQAKSEKMRAKPTSQLQASRARRQGLSQPYVSDFFLLIVAQTKW
jgi:hypothetical protein